MDDTAPVVASAVIVPETEELSAQPLKRRQSSISEFGSKRPRLNNEEGSIHHDAASPPQGLKEEPKSRGTVTDRAEERKRGRRLFGALLGTLSQSSSSTAQKRRTEIERKQQAKLRQQDEEQDEANKERFEALVTARQKEQAVYGKQSMRIRHANLLAQARFLQTRSEPKLFFKPWKLSQKEEETIKGQIEDAQTTVDQNEAQWEQEQEQEQEQGKEPGDMAPESRESSDEAVKNEDVGNGQGETVGDAGDADVANAQHEPSGPDIPDAIADDDHVSSPITDKHVKMEQQQQQQEASKDHAAADGEEVVEGEEDTVIY